MDRIEHLHSRNVTGTSISIIPIPFAEGVRGIDSTVSAPAYLKKHGLTQALSSLGFLVRIETPVKEQHVVGMARGAQRVVASALLRNAKCISIGGSHSISLGSIGGALHVFGNDLGVIWIDAHGDLHTHETSPTGVLRGMPLAALMGFGEDSLVELVTKKLPVRNLLHIGLKDADHAEIALIKRRGINAVTMGNVASRGLADCSREIRRLGKKAKQVWVSLDVDAIDKHDAPASPMATSGVFTYREITNLMRHIGNTCNVIGIDIVEMAPKKDLKGKTAYLCTELVASAFGAVHNWYTTEYLSLYGKSA